MADSLSPAKFLESLHIPSLFRDIIYAIIGFGFFWGLLIFGKLKVADIGLEELSSTTMQIFAFLSLSYIAGVLLSITGAFFSKYILLIWKLIFRKDREKRLRNFLDFYAERSEDLDLDSNTIYISEIYGHLSKNQNLYQQNERDIMHEIFSRTFLGVLIVYSFVISYLFILPAICILIQFCEIKINSADRLRDVAKLIVQKEKKDKSNN